MQHPTQNFNLHRPQGNIQGYNCFSWLATEMTQVMKYDCPFWSKVLAKSRLGQFYEIFWTSAMMLCFHFLTITCAGSEVQRPPFDDPHCTVARLPRSRGSKREHQGIPATHSHNSHPYPRHQSLPPLLQLVYLKQSRKPPTGKLSPPD